MVFGHGNEVGWVVVGGATGSVCFIFYSWHKLIIP